MKEIKNEIFTGERALFASSGLKITDCIFENGESPLKESSDIIAERSLFKWRYPLWYCNNITVRESTFFEQARASVWYSNGVSIDGCMMQSPKSFRRCRGLSLKNVSLVNADETLWHCEGVQIENVTVHGEYFAMNSSGMNVMGLNLFGRYSFDGCKNIEIHNSRLITKDAFWNSENVTVYDSFISSEYLGWNSKSLTLINCTIESLQGLCRIDDLVMKNCTLVNTTLAFEYSAVNADIKSPIASVLNPSGGTIKAQSIGELIIEKDRTSGAVDIICGDIKKVSDKYIP